MTAENAQSPYATLPLEGPQEVAVGHALITMVEPHTGHERAYNRWYEDQHFFRGAMAEPWMFAGRRWVAPKDLKSLRLPESSAFSEQLTKGSYLGTYWITPDRLDDHRAWTKAVNEREAAEGLKFTDSDHVFTSFQDKAGTVYRDADVPNEIFSLMDPAAGIVLEVVDAPSADTRGDLESWLLETHLPSRLQAGGPVSSAMVFQTNALVNSSNKRIADQMAGVSRDGRRLTVLWFLTEDPRECWSSYFVPEQDLVRDGGQGEMVLLAPFIPSKMGTDQYVDQLS